jgi:hypothetical protein
VASLLTRASLLLLLTLACGDTSKQGAPEDPPTEEVNSKDPARAIDAPVAGPEPARAAAQETLSAFGKALLASPTGAIEQYLRIPEGLSEGQLDFFYKELRKKHANEAGIVAVLQRDFGPIAERLGDKAQSVADQLGLSVDETWVFGDVESAAILQWDGQRFWVAGVHKLRGK